MNDIKRANVYDLHTHSHCSDGYLSPQDLVALAKQQGVSVLALTDHDTLEGIAAAQQAAKSSNAFTDDHESDNKTSSGDEEDGEEEDSNTADNHIYSDHKSYDDDKSDKSKKDW